MSPEVVHVLLGRIPKSIPSPCRVLGYSRHPVKDRVYPAMIPADKNSHVDGMIWLDLSEREMQAFDFFEEDDYQRRLLQIQILAKNDNSMVPTDDNEIVQAEGYIWTNPLSQLELNAEWSYENFCQQHLEWYLSNTVAICKRELDLLKQQD